jgi:hypothetical protein
LTFDWASGVPSSGIGGKGAAGGGVYTTGSALAAKESNFSGNSTGAGEDGDCGGGAGGASGAISNAAGEVTVSRSELPGNITGLGGNGASCFTTPIRTVLAGLF